ncbi:MAG: glycoside hydrolase family 25 protein [Flavobacterium sp.]
MAKRRFSKKKKQNPFASSLKYFVGLGLCLFVIFSFKGNISHYLGFTSDKEKNYSKVTEDRNRRILNRYEDHVLGIDVSEYQEKIDWDKVELIEGEYAIDFVFVRATVGNDRVDRRFKENWNELKKKEFIRGAYHYYRPNENSLAQANLFIKTVKLKKGDLPPVLDIEKLPRHQSMSDLKKGLKRWLQKVEAHYKVKPIVYSSERYYADFLKKEFKNYPFWIANYNIEPQKLNRNWKFWQFTEKSSVEGIKGNVDLNVFNGNVYDLKKITLKR